MTGHWEMMGLHITKPFKTFSEHGFPPELIEELSRRTGHVIIGNKKRKRDRDLRRTCGGGDRNGTYDRLYIGGFCAADLWK